MKLTTTMRDALDEARRGPLRRVHDDKPGAPPWPAPAVTLHALVRHGLVVVGRVRNAKGWHVDTWSITDAGRVALDPPARVTRDTPLFLARPSRGTGDYTTNPRRAIDELEVMDATVLDRVWFDQAEERHAEAVDRNARARRLASMRKAA